MSAETKLRIVEVEKLANSVIVIFSDGNAAVYSCELLHGVLDRAEKLDTTELDDE